MKTKTLEDADKFTLDELRDQMVCHCRPTFPLTSEEDCGILIVGEAPGTEEFKTGLPFSSNGKNAGSVLNDCLQDAGVLTSSVSITNVFLERPPSNNVSRFFTDEKQKGTEHLGTFKGRYLLPSMYPHVLFLNKLITEVVKPKVIVSLGNIPLWFFTGQDCGVTRKVGTTDIINGIPVVFTFHPAAVLWGNRKMQMKGQITEAFVLAYEKIQQQKEG